MQAAELLVSLHAQRTLMVVDPFFAMANFVREIRGSLAEKAIASELFTDFQPDPTDQNVLAGAACFSMFAADSIIAIGGGSALDVAKMIGAAAANPGPVSQFQGYHRVSIPGPPLIAVPTTAGTGSEATKVAVITDTARNVKMMILDAKLMPTAAVVDYELTFSMPKPLTAHVGVDALTHGIEAYVSRKANSLTDPVALENPRESPRRLVGRRQRESPRSYVAGRTARRVGVYEFQCVSRARHEPPARIDVSSAARPLEFGAASHRDPVLLAGRQSSVCRDRPRDRTCFRQEFG